MVGFPYNTTQQRGFHLFTVDCTPEPRIFSPTLEDRSYVYAPDRSRNNKKFFYPYSPGEITDTKKSGRPKAYGDTHQLNNPATWHAPDESIEFSQMSARGKLHIIKIDCWNEVIMRGKKDTKLSDYPLRLLRVQVFKASGELLFKRPLWLTAAGKRCMELSLSDIFLSYRQR